MPSMNQPYKAAQGRRSTANQVVGKFPGKCLAQAGGEWREQCFNDFRQELAHANAQTSRIISVERHLAHLEHRGLSDAERTTLEKKKPYEVFASDEYCRSFMIHDLGFPAYLFTEAWSKSNGFAGSMKTSNEQPANISWFRVLVKVTNGLGAYDWHEVTFFIHQQDASGHFTVICFELPDDEVSTAASAPGSGSYNFLDELRLRLNKLSPATNLDWRYIQSVFLEQVIVFVDQAVWACSRAVRDIERSRDKTFEFPQAHDLLRHALHMTEVLNVASQTLSTWLDAYSTSQRRSYRLELQQAQPSVGDAYHEDLPLPAAACHEELAATVQLLSNLVQRSSSNDARLRNEINLAFNLVNQRDAKAMRTISIVTLFFLPATFVSTLFSMSFFSFQPPYQTGWGASPWIWLYFALAAPLTGVAVSMWYWVPLLAWMEKKWKGVAN